MHSCGFLTVEISWVFGFLDRSVCSCGFLMVEISVGLWVSKSASCCVGFWVGGCVCGFWWLAWTIVVVVVVAGRWSVVC